jgi:hypothetical protein
VVSESPDEIHLDSPMMHPSGKARIFFGGVRRGKNYVSFHLMPVYTCRELLDGMSDALKARMQGKSCFNFRSVDEPLMKELERLTRKGFERFRKAKFVT